MTFGGRYWADTFVDLMYAWRCGSFKDFISLDALSRYLGAGQKVGSGEKFWKLWQTDQKAAVEYLCNDVLLPARCAENMGYMTASA
jgi:hypothetical protein